MKQILFAGIGVVAMAGLFWGCESGGSNRWPVDGGTDPGDVRSDGSFDTNGPDAREPDGGRHTGEDTGPDCSLDTDADGLSDCDEAELCTSPTDGDTDDDQLSDFEELQAGTDPCRADTDNDGATDSEELDLGLNPNKPSTFGDGISDGDRWRVYACAPPEDPNEDFTGTIDYYGSDTANYKIGLSPGFSNYRQLKLGNLPAPIAAGVYGDSLTSVYGFILSKEAETERTEPDVSLVEFVRPEVFELAGNQQENLIFEMNGGAFATHNQHQAAIGRYHVETPTERSAAAVREDLLLGLDAFDKEDIDGTGLPSTDEETHSRFRIFVSVILRANASWPNQALISAAVTPASVYESRNQVRFQMDDLTNTTNISEVVDVTRTGCETFTPAEEIPEAYFYWVLDQSGSMAAENETLSGFSQRFIERTRRTQLGFKLGVTNMDPRNNGRLYNPWTTSATQFFSDVRNGVIDCTGWNCAGETSREEKGLQVAMEGIRFMRGLTTQRPPPVEAIDSNAAMYTVFFTDEHASSVQDDNVPVQTYIDFFRGAGDTTVFSIAGTPDCAEHGSAYQDVARSTGGRFASVCSGDLEGILSDIIYTAVGEQSEYKLSRTPVSASLTVFMEGNEDPTTSQFVPRYRENGFEYFAQNNSIAFFGSYRPELSDGEISEDFVAVRYEYFDNFCVSGDCGD